MPQSTPPSQSDETLTLGKRIHRYREKLGLTQRQLGDKVKVTEGMVGKWERDENTPSPEKRLALAKALRLPAALMDYEVPDDEGLDGVGPPGWAVQHHEQQMAALRDIRETLDALMAR